MCTVIVSGLECPMSGRRSTSRGAVVKLVKLPGKQPGFKSQQCPNNTYISGLGKVLKMLVDAIFAQIWGIFVLLD